MCEVTQQSDLEALRVILEPAPTGELVLHLQCANDKLQIIQKDSDDAASIHDRRELDTVK